MDKAWIVLIGLLIVSFTYAGEVKNQDPFALGITDLKRSIPIYLYYDPSVPTEFYPAFEAAAQTWSKAIGRPAFYFNGESNGNHPDNDGFNVIYWLNPFPGPQNYEAETPIYWENKEIQDTDMVINAENFEFSTAPKSPQVDIESVALHEMGHMLGLGHITGQPSVMNPALNGGVIRRKLFPIDLVNIKSKYP